MSGGNGDSKYNEDDIADDRARRDLGHARERVSYDDLQPSKRHRSDYEGDGRDDRHRGRYRRDYDDYDDRDRDRSRQRDGERASSRDRDWRDSRDRRDGRGDYRRSRDRYDRRDDRRSHHRDRDRDRDYGRRGSDRGNSRDRSRDRSYDRSRDRSSRDRSSRERSHDRRPSNPSDDQNGQAQAAPASRQGPDNSRTSEQTSASAAATYAPSTSAVRRRNSEAEDDEEYRKRVEAQLEDDSESESEDTKAERRRAERRAMAEKLRAKLASSNSNGNAANGTGNATVKESQSNGPTKPVPVSSAPETKPATETAQDSDSEGDLQLGENDLMQDGAMVDQAGGDEVGADFDEMGQLKREQEERDARVAVIRAQQEHQKQQQQQSKEAKDTTAKADEFDMFSASPPVPIKAPTGTSLAGQDENLTLNDNWDDREGYYSFRANDMLDGRYLVVENMGRGVFSSVFRAIDKQQNDLPVCIKIIRANKTMFDAAQKEIMLLERIRDHDPLNKKHVVRLHSHFEYRNHLCLVFEPLAMNLRQVLRKYGRQRGLNIKAVRWYAKQLFTALAHLQQCNVMHADLKLDNILVDSNMSLLKVCDFGSASEIQENEATPYLVSRFYRAPEIILGLKYDQAIDMWSAGCCIYELYTGKILFPGKSNNEMLKGFMDVRGTFAKKLIRRGQFNEQHFDPDCNFLMNTEDPYTKKRVVKVLPTVEASRTMSDLLTPTINQSDANHRRHVTQLIDLLDKVLSVDPAKRISAAVALKHPFVKEHA